MGIVPRLLSWFGWTPGDRSRTVRSPAIDFPALEKVLHHKILNPRLSVEALSHRSYLQISENDDTVSYERLEFLGDAVLSLIVGDYLFHTYVDAPEGELTKLRSRLVNRKALGLLGAKIHLADFLLMSTNAAQSGSKGMESILADAYEAIIGAIYLDGGYTAAKQFVDGAIQEALKNGLLHIEDENFKSQLLEQTQAISLGTPRYIITHEDGPDHDRTFTIEVQVLNVTYGVGVGKNKKDAEQAAAEQALHQLQNEHTRPPTSPRQESRANGNV